MNIDVHAHFLPRNCFDIVDTAGKHYGPTIVADEQGQEHVFLDDTNWGPIARQFYDPETRIKDMDTAGIDVQILSPSPLLLYYNLEVETCLWFSKKQNDGIAQVVNEYPTRFLGLATIPLQDPHEAMVELDRAINKLELRGIEILSNINGRDLDAPELLPFYKEVESLDIPVFIHPDPRNIAGSERMRRYYLTNLIGNLLDTTLAAASLIFGGILEKFPGIKFCLAHGGGNLPYIRGRLEHGYHIRAECKINIKQPPSCYIPLLYFETITHFLPALEYLVASVGTDKVMLGTDYPYDMADSNPVSRIHSLTSISEDNRQQILGGNATRIFKLSKTNYNSSLS